MACLFTTSTFCQHAANTMAEKALPACCQNCGIFRMSGRHNIPLTTDEEQLESTNAVRSIPLIFTFITGSTSSSLCGERVVLASHTLPRFPDSLVRHILVAGTDNCISGSALCDLPPGCQQSLAK